MGAMGLWGKSSVPTASRSSRSTRTAADEVITFEATFDVAGRATWHPGRAGLTPEIGQSKVK